MINREQREKERYQRLRSLSPDLFRRSVELGSLVAFETGNQRSAYKAESAAISIVLEALDSMQPATPERAKEGK